MVPYEYRDRAYAIRVMSLAKSQDDKYYYDALVAQVCELAGFYKGALFRAPTMDRGVKTALENGHMLAAIARIIWLDGKSHNPTLNQEALTTLLTAKRNPTLGGAGSAYFDVVDEKLMNQEFIMTGRIPAQFARIGSKGPESQVAVDDLEAARPHTPI